MHDKIITTIAHNYVPDEEVFVKNRKKNVG